MYKENKMAISDIAKKNILNVFYKLAEIVNRGGREDAPVIVVSEMSLHGHKVEVVGLASANMVNIDGNEIPLAEELFIRLDKDTFKSLRSIEGSKPEIIYLHGQGSNSLQ